MVAAPSCTHDLASSMNSSPFRLIHPFRRTIQPLRSTRVTRLRRCRVGGGALGCPHAGLRPPLKRSVQFSRTPLSQRHATSVGGWKELVRSSVPDPTNRTDDVPAAVSSPDTATA